MKVKSSLDCPLHEVRLIRKRSSRALQCDGDASSNLCLKNECCPKPTEGQGEINIESKRGCNLRVDKDVPSGEDLELMFVFVCFLQFYLFTIVQYMCNIGFTISSYVSCMFYISNLYD